MKWRMVCSVILFSILTAMPILGLQIASAAEDSQSLAVGSWWAYKGTYRQVSTGSGSWGGTYTETGEYTQKILVTDKTSDTITLSRQEDGKWSCTATDTWYCTKNAKVANDTWSDSYQYTIALNSLKMTNVGGGVDTNYVGHPTWYMVNVEQLAEGGKDTQYWWVPNSDAKGDKITDVDFSVGTQNASIMGVQLKVWRLSYTGDALGWWNNDGGVYSVGPATKTNLYDPVHGVLVDYSFKHTTKGVAGGGSWTEDYSEGYQLEDTNLSFTVPVITPATVPVTLNAEPGTHITVTVDAVRYASDQLPTVFDWTVGSTHTLEVNPTVEGATGVQYVFVQWSDGSKDASRTLTATEEASLTATFKTQYELTVSSELGAPQGSGWYDADTQPTFSVTTPLTVEGFMGTLGGAYIFDHWSGDTTATTPSASVTMDGPKTVMAEWRTDNTMPYTVIGAVIGLIALAIVALLILRRKAGAPRHVATVTSSTQTAPSASAQPPPPAASSKFCTNCGASLAASAKFCAECGSKQ